jgi:hypothetical protein
LLTILYTEWMKKNPNRKIRPLERIARKEAEQLLALEETTGR